MSTTETRRRILDAAERIIADRGYPNVTVRAVTARAGVNLAAIHYHFGSREKLLHAVLERRFRQVGQEQIRRLEGIEEAAPSDRRPDPRAILEAFLIPLLRLRSAFGGDDWVLNALLGHLYSWRGETEESLVGRHFSRVARRFLEALERALPQLPRLELAWRLQGAILTMHFLATGAHRVERIAGVDLAADDEEATRYILRFATAALCAPSSRTTLREPGCGALEVLPRRKGSSA